MKVSISVPGTFHAFQLGEQLIKRSTDVTMFSTHPKFAIDTTLPDSEINSIRHPELVSRISSQIPIVSDYVPSSRWKSLLFDRAVARRLSSADPDIFLGFAGSAGQSIKRAHELDAIPLVERSSTHIRAQASILQEEFNRFDVEQTPIDEQDIRRQEREYEAAAKVITPSKFVYDSFLDQGFSEKKLVCEPFGVNTDTYSPPDPGEGRHADETVRFLFAGRVGLRKGIPYLLDAWENISLEDAELLIAGPADPDGHRFVDEYESHDSIQFLGWVNDINSLYADCDALVFPTLEEGSAYVTYEAMACGIPVITTPHSGWVGEDGIHGCEVPIRSPEELADAIEALYHDAEVRDRMGRDAREYVATSYTWDQYGDRLFDRYRKILDDIT